MRYVKRGRPTKDLKSKIDRANQIILSLDDSKKQRYNDLIINNEQELDSLLNELDAPPQITNIKTNTMAEIDFDFSPLEAPVKERSYNKQQVSNDVSDIPEPNFDFTPTPQQQTATSNSQTQQQASTSYSSDPEPSYTAPLGEGPNEMDDKSKKQAASQLADTLLDAYKMAHQFAGNFAKVDQAKIIEKVSTGELDPTIKIPVDENGTETGPVEFFEIQNEQIEETFQYDPEFGKRVKPAMVRVFEKRGIGLSDEQFLMVEFGKDIAIKTALLIGMKKQQKMMLNMFITMSQQKQSGMEHDGPVSSVAPDHITKEEPQIVEQKAPVSADEVEEALEVKEETNE